MEDCNGGLCSDLGIGITHFVNFDDLDGRAPMRDSRRRNGAADKFAQILAGGGGAGCASYTTVSGFR